MELTVLKTPVRAPPANVFCDRLVDTIRRECLDFLIPLNERHVGRCLPSGCVTSIADVRTRAWGLASWIRL
jgi:hypothetical protein